MMLDADDLEPRRELARRIARARPFWMREAACSGHETRVFFPEHGQSTKAAIAVCASCPVLTPCRDMAIADPALDHGVLGGMTAKARRRARAERAARPERMAQIYR